MHNILDKIYLKARKVSLTMERSSPILENIYYTCCTRSRGKEYSHLFMEDLMYFVEENANGVDREEPHYLSKKIMSKLREALKKLDSFELITNIFIIYIQNF